MQLQTMQMRGGAREGAGRPKGSALPPEKRKSIKITIVLNSGQLSRIKQAAQVEGHPFSRWIRLVALRAANNLLDNQ